MYATFDFIRSVQSKRAAVAFFKTHLQFHSLFVPLLRPSVDFIRWKCKFERFFLPRWICSSSHLFQVYKQGLIANREWSLEDIAFSHKTYNLSTNSEVPAFYPVMSYQLTIFRHAGLYSACTVLPGIST